MEKTFNEITAEAEMWGKFVAKCADRELNDDHLTTSERKQFVAEWKRRNPNPELAGVKLTGDLDTDFVNMVF